MENKTRLEWNKFVGCYCNVSSVVRFRPGWMWKRKLALSIDCLLSFCEKGQNLCKMHKSRSQALSPLPSWWWCHQPLQNLRGISLVQYTQFESDRLFIESIRLTGSQVAIFKTEVKSSYRKLSREAREGCCQLKAIRSSNSQVEIVYSLYASNYIFCSLLKRGATNTLHTMYILRSKSMRPQTRRLASSRLILTDERRSREASDESHEETTCPACMVSNF